MDITSIKYYDLPPLNEQGYANPEHVNWIESQLLSLLWSVEDIAREAGISADRVRQLELDKIPGSVKLAGRRFFIAHYAKVWCEHRKAYPPKRGPQAGAGTEKVRTKGKPKEKPVRLPAYIKQAQESTPHLVLIDTAIAVDAPGVTALHHHWSDFGMGSGTPGRPKGLGKWRKFRFQGQACFVPLRFANPRAFSVRLLQDIGRTFPQFCVVNDSDWGFALTELFTTYSQLGKAIPGREEQFAAYQQLVALREEVWNIRDRLKSVYLES